MINLLKYIFLTIIWTFLFTQTSSWNTGDFLWEDKDIKTPIQEIIQNINESKTENEKQLDKISNDLWNIQKEIKIDGEINEKNKESINEEIVSLKNINSNLEKENNQLKQIIKDLQLNKAKNLSKIKDLENKINKNKNILLENENVIKYYENELIKINLENKKNAQYLNNIKTLYSEQKKIVDNENKKKLDDILYYYWIVIFIFFIIILWKWVQIWKKEDKENRIKSIKLELKISIVIFLFITILSILIWFFYIFNENLIYLALWLGPLILVFQKYIVWFFNSFFLLLKYKIGDFILIWENENTIIKWKILSIWLFSTKILSYNEKEIHQNKLITIPNYKFNENIIHLQIWNIVSDKISISLKWEELIKYNKIREWLIKIINKNSNNLLLWYSSKFKEVLKIEDWIVNYTLIWNETVENNLIIKNLIVQFLIKNKLYENGV